MTIPFQDRSREWLAAYAAAVEAHLAEVVDRLGGDLRRRIDAAVRDADDHVAPKTLADIEAAAARSIPEADRLRLALTELDQALDHLEDVRDNARRALDHLLDVETSPTADPLPPAARKHAATIPMTEEQVARHRQRDEAFANVMAAPSPRGWDVSVRVIGPFAHGELDPKGPTVVGYIVHAPLSDSIEAVALACSYAAEVEGRLPKSDTIRVLVERPPVRSDELDDE